MIILFDTAVYEESLTASGITADLAKAHRQALQRVLDVAANEFASNAEIKLMETRLETRIGEKIQDATWKILGGVSLIVAIATAIIKLA